MMLAHEFLVLELWIEINVYVDNNRCPSIGKGTAKSFKLLCICRRYLVRKYSRCRKKNLSLFYF